MNANKNELFCENIRKNDSFFHKTVVYYRWLFIALVLPAFIYASDQIVPLYSLLETLAVTVVYNIIVNLLVFGKKSEAKQILRIASFIDVVLITVFSYQLGGISSDIYLILLFVIAFFGICSNPSNVLGLSLFTVIIYSASTYCSAKSLAQVLNFWSLFLRDFFIMMSAVGISFVVKEVRKYNEMHKKEFKLARTDKLTGLANRRYLEQKLSEESQYADFSGEPLNVLIFDLDNFKKFNDSYGHIWGDKLLSLFSDIIKQNIRKDDIPVRYGGEEFLILIKGLSIDMAKSVGERIRRQLEKQRIYIGDEDNRKKVTVSCGVAQYPKHSKNINEIIDLADKALYRAKEIGKNIVVAYDEIGRVSKEVQMDIDI